MTAKRLGPTFGDEVIAAGLGGLPFVWGDTEDDFRGRADLTVEQNAELDRVVAAHNPDKKRELTLEGKLAQVGLTLDELKQAMK